MQKLRRPVGVGHFGVGGDSGDRVERALAEADAASMKRLGELRWSDLAKEAAPPAPSLAPPRSERALGTGR